MNRKKFNDQQIIINQKLNKHGQIKNANRKEGMAETIEDQFEEYISEQDNIFSTIVMRQFRRK